MTPRFNTELFLLAHDGTYMAYAPLRRLVMRLEPAQVNLLARLKSGRARAADLTSPLVTFFRQVGLLDGAPEQQPRSFVGMPYAPTRVTLFLTNRCNLGCCYCYAGGQLQPMAMPEEMGRAAIDYVAANCVKRRQTILSVGLHGGGEPTMAWELLVSLTRYAKQVARRHGLKPNLGMSTNAVFSEAKALWITRNLNYVSVSFDGPPRIQDQQRPLKNGRPSSAHVMRVLQTFDREKFPYSFQATITARVVSQMPAIVRYWAKRTHPQFVKFEPVSDCGRFLGNRKEIPNGLEFARSFNTAFDLAQQLGLRLTFSGIRLWDAAVGYFCGAFAEPFAVTPDGHVSACYEAYSAQTPYASVFLFGRWNPAKRSFGFDLKKLERLRRRNVYTLKPCRWCFCKYSCGGDCVTRNFRLADKPDLRLVGARCEAIREITKCRLAKYLDAASRTKAATPRRTKHEDARQQASNHHRITQAHR